MSVVSHALVLPHFFQQVLKKQIYQTYQSIFTVLPSTYHHVLSHSHQAMPKQGKYKKALSANQPHKKCEKNIRQVYPHGTV